MFYDKRALHAARVRAWALVPRRTAVIKPSRSLPRDSSTSLGMTLLYPRGTTPKHPQTLRRILHFVQNDDVAVVKLCGSLPRDSSATLGMTERCGVEKFFVWITMRGKNVLFINNSGRPPVAPTNRKRAYKLINNTNQKVFCHVELVETSRGSVVWLRHYLI